MNSPAFTPKPDHGIFLTGLYTHNVNDTAASGRGIWEVTQPLEFYSVELGRLITVEVGFLTDYGSVPRFPLAYWLVGDRAHKAAVIHDWLFHHHEVCDEQMANKVYLEAAKATGIPAWAYTILYLGVAIGGKSSWEEDGKSNGHSIVNGKIV